MTSPDDASPSPHAHGGHHQAHVAHHEHAGHSVDMFRRKFWGTLLLSIPTVIWAPMIQHWLGYEAWGGPTASRFVSAFFGTLVFAYAGWVFVHNLWVHADLRRQGVGRELLTRVEHRGAELGCHSVWLDTFSFQAPGFYEKAGFKRVAQLDGFPEGHSNVILCKQLM